MPGLIGSALSAVSAVFGYLNTEASRKYLNDSVQLSLDIESEEAKGEQADDAKLESLYAKAKVIFQAAKDELALVQAQSK